MPYFSFSINENIPTLKKFHITENEVYFSKNTQLWKLLNKINISNLNKLKQEKRHKVKKIGKKILFCLPPNIGLGDAIEYASAIKIITEQLSFYTIAVAFSENYTFIFENFFKITNTYPFVIKKTELDKFETIFHLTLEIKSLANQKYFRSNIVDNTIEYFKIKKLQKNYIQTKLESKVNKISIFPLSNSPIRTMNSEILNSLINLLKKDYNIEIFLDNNSPISNYLLSHIKTENISIIDPVSVFELVYYIKEIEYGIFMDSGPLHAAKMFNKRGVLLETSVSKNILLKDYTLIKGINNSFSSLFCTAPCGLTDIFNHNNNYGCYDSIKMESKKFKNNNFVNMINRGVKNHYLENFKNPVGCVFSLNVQNIYNTVRKDLSL